MGLSRTTRISLLLAIDVVFFLIEIIVGYAVGSLALVADSFHMLNDVASLVIALYAIKLTAQTHTDTRYSYGWHRAEILAALVNGVFLLALCFSIFMEAIERFFSTPEVGNPKLVVIVGSFGLASNILGLFLFHEHGHSHSHSHGSKPNSASPSKAASIASAEDATLGERPASPPQYRAQSQSPQLLRKTRERSESYSSLYGHPAATRASLVQTAADMARERSPQPVGPHRTRSNSRPLSSVESFGAGSSSHVDAEEEDTGAVTPVAAAHERTALLAERHDHDHDHDHAEDPSEQGHSSGHGHSHGSMNMRAILLHVLGDALGNVGVIATGLIIWLSSWSLKFYCDPIISLVITVIIFQSALPLVRSTSFILLQGVPSEISFDQVRNDILDVQGVLSVHELHIWQLSESKVIASVHVTASRKIDFMPVASDIRSVLHSHGIHSSTIQPEYHPQAHAVPDEHLKTTADTRCLVDCPNDHSCSANEACCPPRAGAGEP
ncbi:cation efflux protein [Peniophora sp. CONT]|nr:cation efflux protein [Peniophora sp. CONT]